MKKGVGGGSGTSTVFAPDTHVHQTHTMKQMLVVLHKMVACTHTHMIWSGWRPQADASCRSSKWTFSNSSCERCDGTDTYLRSGSSVSFPFLSFSFLFFFFLLFSSSASISVSFLVSKPVQSPELAVRCSWRIDWIDFFFL